MSTEVNRGPISEYPGSRAIGNLVRLSESLRQKGIDIRKKPHAENPVDSAAENADFINTEITNKTYDYFSTRKPTKRLGFTPLLSLEFSYLFYNPTLQRLQIHIPKIGGDLDMDVDGDSLKRLWDEDLSKYSVKLLANMSKEDIIKKFESYIAKNK